jgi:hypothetical protein
MKFPFGGNGGNKYQVPQVADIPERKAEDQTGTYINESERMIMIKIFDSSDPLVLAAALGTLEMAKDIVKQQLTAWHDRERRRSAILTPKLHGN